MRIIDFVPDSRCYVNHENLAKLAKKNKAWKDIQTDIKQTEAYFSTTYAPSTLAQKSHVHATANVLLMKNNPQQLKRYINESAQLRKSLG